MLALKQDGTVWAVRRKQQRRTRKWRNNIVKPTNSNTKPKQHNSDSLPEKILD